MGALRGSRRAGGTANRSLRKLPGFVPGQLLIQVKPAALRGAARSARGVALASNASLPAAVADPFEYLRENA
ncbi:MAG: hypothetical protein ACKV0T_23970, partial [Planctomycetales bacterium]